MSTFQIATALVLWGSLFLIWHTYFGIYLYLLLVAPRKSGMKSKTEQADLPSITVLIAAYNEEKIIADKIENTLAQEYPADRINIVVASDLSSDRTEDIVRSYVDRGVELIVMEERSGKNGINDKLIRKSKGEVVVVTDANTMLQPNALLQMGKHYADPQVGAVCGNIELVPPQDARNVEREMTYRNYELKIRRLMGRLGLVIGGIGGFYSLRRDLYRPIGSGPFHEDIIVLMEILAQGYKVNFAEDGLATEETTESISREFTHRIRLTSFTPSTFPRALRLAWKAGPQAFFLALSYKGLRWVSPYIWVLAMAAAVVLAPVNLLYMLIAGIFIVGIAMALLGWLMDLMRIRLGLFASAYHFTAMNVASFIGLYKWSKGLKPYWTPEER